MTFKYEVKPYFTAPIRKRKNPKLTAREIVSAASKNAVKKAKLVAIVNVEIKRTPKILEGYTTYRVHTHNTSNKHEYRLTIWSDTPVITSKSKLIIDSPNPVWVFTYEYAMAKIGNAFIYRCNGDPPLIKNPGNKPGIDHHVYAAIKYLSKNSKEIMLRIEAEKEKIRKAKAREKAKLAREAEAAAKAKAKVKKARR